MEPIMLTNERFDELLAGEMPLFVDFYADWCGPCKMLSPLVKEIAAEREGSIAVAKLNVDKMPEIANRYGIVAIPALILFKDGEVIDKIVGYREKEELDAWLDERI